MKNQHNYLIRKSITTQDLFLEDMVSLFLEIESGHVGKYIYEDHTATDALNVQHDYLWQHIITQDNSAYYMPHADNELLAQTLRNIRYYIPDQTPIVDFGLGGVAAFRAHICPFIDKLACSTYVGLDFCKGYLDAIQNNITLARPIEIKTIEMDFFNPHTTKVTNTPSLGIMTCSTIGNIYGSTQDKIVDLSLIRSLKTISSLTKNGWLLLSVDTNQDEPSLIKGYDTPLMAQLFLTVMQRLYRELPHQGFNPSLFVYTPEWYPETQLLAHIAVATAAQDFMLGDYHIHVQEGQKYHLLNSYKFKPKFFEDCCDKANLDILNVWHHESPMKLYLLEDRANPYNAAKRQENRALLTAFAARDARGAGFSKDFTQAANIIGARATHHTNRKTRCAARC